MQVAATDSDLSCQGCPTTDTRVQITGTTTYPYSAVGELIGELGTTDEYAAPAAQGMLDLLVILGLCKGFRSHRF